ncbi:MULTISPECIES: hypothetical protein [Sporosarcina]|uniref:Uncharacterized protein n=1 Tax=Sporosarcina contaminans TaxID=633403 RepID=A0ABW3U3S3_9BACL
MHSTNSCNADVLLTDDSDEKVTVHYGETTFRLPKIGPRPPFYYNPRCEPYYPEI